MPAAAVPLAVKVRTLVDVVGFVPKVAVTPPGKLETERVTDPLKPPDGTTVMVLLPLEPAAIARLVAPSEKSAGVVTGGRMQLFAALENSSWM